MSRLADSLAARVAAAKRRLVAGGLLREVEWGKPGARDVRGRRTVAYTMLDALIEQRPALDRATLSTDRTDNTVLIILDPVAITDADTFRWGSPPHVYRIKQVDGVVRDEETGTRFFSEVVVIR